MVDQFGQISLGVINHENGDGECDPDDSREVVMVETLVEIVFLRN